MPFPSCFGPKQPSVHASKPKGGAAVCCLHASLTRASRLFWDTDDNQHPPCIEMLCLELLCVSQEFNIEKLQLLEAEKAKIRKDYERREGQIDVKKKMYVLCDAVLSALDECCDDSANM